MKTTFYDVFRFVALLRVLHEIPNLILLLLLCFIATLVLKTWQLTLIFQLLGVAYKMLAKIITLSNKKYFILW